MFIPPHSSQSPLRLMDFTMLYPQFWCFNPQRSVRTWPVPTFSRSSWVFLWEKLQIVPVGSPQPTTQRRRDRAAGCCGSSTSIMPCLSGQSLTINKKFALHDCRYAIAAEHVNILMFTYICMCIYVYICTYVGAYTINIAIYIYIHNISITIQLYMEGIWQISPVSEPENDRDSLEKLVKCSERSYVSTSTLSICSAFHPIRSATSTYCGWYPKTCSPGINLAELPSSKLSLLWNIVYL